MRVSAELSHILGITTKAVVDAHIELLKKYKLPYQVPKNISPEDILLSLRFNKKYYSGEPRFVLVKKIGTYGEIMSNQPGSMARSTAAAGAARAAQHQPGDRKCASADRRVVTALCRY